MPQDSRQRTQRKEVNLAGDRQVQLQNDRRFFSAQGSDKATREARALQAAFGEGTQLASALTDKANVEGLDRAKVDAARGVRDEQDSNHAYNKAWEEMDAEKDFNLLQKTLGEKLRGADWENLPETAVQQIITDTMADELAGAEHLSFYGPAIAPKLLELEDTLIGQHRDNVIERVKAEQRTTIFENLTTRFDDNGEFDYEYLGEGTKTFFDGAEKRATYWATVFDFAIRNGRVDIIDNVPERFGGPESDLTRSNDPEFQAELRAARAAAMGQAAKLQAKEDAAIVAQNDDARFKLQMQIYRTGQAGGDVSGLIRQLEGIPDTKFSDVTASKNFADSQFSENEDRSPAYATIGTIYAKIHTGAASPANLMAEVFEAASRGDLGTGETGVDNMNEMIAKIDKLSTSGESLRKTAVTEWRGSLNRRYNAATGGLLKGINPVMQRINIDANDKYNDLVLNGTNPRQAWDEVIREFDPLVQNLPDVSEEELSSRRAQGSFTYTDAQRINADSIRNIRENPEAIRDLAGVPRYLLSLIHISEPTRLC